MKSTEMPRKLAWKSHKFLRMDLGAMKKQKDVQNWQGKVKCDLKHPVKAIKMDKIASKWHFKPLESLKIGLGAFWGAKFTSKWH